MGRERNIRKNRVMFGSVLVFFGLVATVFLTSFSANVMAEDGSGYYVKGIASAVIECYKNGSFKPSFKAKDWNVQKPINSFMRKNNSVYIPYGANGEDATIGCMDLVGNLAGGLIPSASASGAEKTAFVSELGYYAETTSKNAGSGGKCFSLQYVIVGNSPTARQTISSDKVCASKIVDGKIAVNSLTVYSGDPLVPFKYNNGTSGKLTPDCNLSAPTNGGCVKHTFDKKNYTTNWESFINEIKDDILKNASETKELRDSAGNIFHYVLKGLEEEGTGTVDVQEADSDDEEVKYNLTVDATSLSKGTSLLTGSSYGSLPTFSDDETFALYTGYLYGYYGAKTPQCGLTDDQLNAGTGNKNVAVVKTCDSDEIKVCKVEATKNQSKKVGGISGGTFGTGKTFQEIADWLNDFDASGKDDASLCESTPIATSSNNNPTVTPSNPAIVLPTIDPNTPANQAILSTEDMVDCNDLQAIGSMQWVLCPTMNNMEYTASWIDNMTQNWLSVDTELYSGSDIYNVWQNIRNVANVLMILFLIVVVISQLTGYGIDNYGIKKMLPRLIVMAVVINLSYYICQLAIDASNIVGAGLRDMFGAFGNALGKNSVGDASFIGGAVTGLFAAAGGGGSAAIGAGITAATLGAGAAVAVVIAVIVLLVIILIAVMVLFLMLGAREIIVVMCVVLSPLAFAAFILPNTQNLFKKWWDLFKAAIIIFPICGAMSGISYMLRVMAQGSEMEWYAIAVVMVLPYLGFFLIPILLKNALSALGKIGGALTAMGGTIKNGGRAMVQGGIKVAQNTEGFKNMQAEGLRRRQEQSSQRTIERLEQLKEQRRQNGAEEGKELTEAETRQLARAHETQRKLGAENTAARTVLTEREYAGLSTDRMVHDWREAWDNGDTGRMNALTNVIISRNGAGGANELAKQFATMEGNRNGIFRSDGEFRNEQMRDSFNAFQSNLMQNSALANAMSGKASDVYQMFTSGGYSDVSVDVNADGSIVKDENGDAIIHEKAPDEASIRHNLSSHSAANNLAAQNKDWATQSNATLQRSATAGSFDAARAQSLLSSQDAAIQSGIQSDTDKASTLMAVASGYKGDWNDKTAVQQAIQKYITDNGGFDPRNGGDRNNLARDINRIANNMEQQRNNGSGPNTPSSNGPTFGTDGAGI